MRDWTELAAFDGIDLSESFVLSWDKLGACLRFEADFVLTPGHPQYQPPKPGEWACFRRGSLDFPNAKAIGQLPEMANVRPAVDASGETDFGHFDRLIEASPGRFELDGDFGTFVLESEAPKVSLS